MAKDPLVPLAGMALVAMLLLGSANGEPASDGTREAVTERPAAASSAVGKVYTPRLVLGGSTEGGGPEAAAPACATADARGSYSSAVVHAEGAGA